MASNWAGGGRSAFKGTGQVLSISAKQNDWSILIFGHTFKQKVS
jgi:predicted phosphodiesterase